MRVAHRPRQAGADAVIAVARHLTADAPDRVPQREPDRGGVEHPQRERAPPPHPSEHRDGAPDHAAVPHQARAREGVADEVVLDLVVVLDQVVAARPHHAAHQRREDHLIRPVGGLSQLPEPARHDRAAADEPQRERHPEGLDGDSEDFDFRFHRGEGPERSQACSHSRQPSIKPSRPR